MSVNHVLDSTRKSALMLMVGAILLVGCGEAVVTQQNDDPDPVVVDIPVAFVKRTLPVDDNGMVMTSDLREPTQFIGGAALFIKNRASVSSEEINITDRVYINDQTPNDDNGNPIVPQYDVKDLEVSYDGTKLIFAMRAPALDNANDDEQPTWNIWEYDRTDDVLRRVIRSDIVAESGHDTGPVYLPDGRIMFSSTRQRTNQAILIDEGKAQFAGLTEDLVTEASVLHVMDANGEDITQVSFNQSHDLDPLVMPNGKVLFTRWDRAVRDKGMHLYQMNPDGSQLEIVYGRHSHQINNQTVHFTQSRMTPDGQVLVAVREYESNLLGGNVFSLDIENYIDIEGPVAGSESLDGPGQVAAIFDNIDLQADISPGGYVAALYPLFDGSDRQLLAWSQCRVYDPEQVAVEGQQRTILPCTESRLSTPGIEAAPLLYGLWIYDPQTHTQQVIATPVEGTAYTELVSMESRAFPADFNQSDDYDSRLADQHLGRIHIRSVYDMAGEDTTAAGLDVMANPQSTPATDRPIRFVRVVKGVSIPSDDVVELNNSHFGPSRSVLMREIIGYAEVEPDGSVLIDVPANIPLSLSFLDATGKRVFARHDNWLQVVPGEIKRCNGCHSASNTLPHGRRDAEYPSINLGAAASGAYPGANPELAAEVGETMAQTKGRIIGVTSPQADITFDDIWANPATTVLAPSLNYAYGDMRTPLPISQSCAQNWTSLCRITVNYPDHIQPLFELDRRELDSDGNVVSDVTCIRCHAPVSELGETQVPAGQLDLSPQPSLDNAAQLTGFRELLFNDNEVELIDGVLLDKLIEATDDNGNTVFATDENDELILDTQGNPVPVLVNVMVRAPARAGNARASNVFFNLFQSGSHSRYLSDAELKLIAEWLDIGAQYYNNPFDVVQE